MMIFPPVLSLFTIVSFKNDACASLSGNNGTCYSSKVIAPSSVYTLITTTIRTASSKGEWGHQHHHHHPNHRLIIIINITITIIRTASSKGEWGQALVPVDLESAVFVSCIFLLLMRTILDHQFSRVVILSCIYATKHGGTIRIWRQDRKSGRLWFPEVFCLNPTLRAKCMVATLTEHWTVNRHLLVHRQKITVWDIFGYICQERLS